MTKRGRPPKEIGIPQSRVIVLCANCPLSQCRGTGDALCPVRIETRKYWSRKNRKRVEYQRERYLAKKNTATRTGAA
jgi:hypothetical protein